jgi:hypothetical protein
MQAHVTLVVEAIDAAELGGFIDLSIPRFGAEADRLRCSL